MRCPMCCSKDFNCKRELTEHLKLVQSSLKCPLCKEQTEDLRSLIIHLENQCSNNSEVSCAEQSSTSGGVQTLENTSLNKDLLSEDVSMDSSVGNSKENKVLPLRKRKKSNLSQLSKRKTSGKNISNELSPPTPTSDLPSGTVNNQPLSSNTENAQSVASQPTQSSAAESEIDVDNISMLSDESSFTTTNDYSSSQNEILSDDDCNESGVIFSVESNSDRHAPSLRNNERQGNNGFVNNLQVINNNFHTNSLKIGNRPNIPQEIHANYQRRNTKNNNIQFNKSQASTSSSSSASDQGSSRQNNLQTCKTSNLNPLTFTNNATSLPLPRSGIFTVANNSPQKYNVKNSNISKNIPVGSKEVATANSEQHSSASGNNNNSNPIVSDVNSRQDDTSRLLAGSNGSVAENTMDIVLQENAELSSNNITSHPLVARTSSNRMQKIQNVDCIQNSSSSSYPINPSASALCKTNSFSLSNYVQKNQATSKLFKSNASQSGEQQILSTESEGTQSNSQTSSASSGTVVTNSTTSTRQQIRSPTINDTSQCNGDEATNSSLQSIQSGSSEKTVRNVISMTDPGCNSVVIASQHAETNSETKDTNQTSNLTGYEVATNIPTSSIQPTSDTEANNETLQDDPFPNISQHIPSTLNNLNNTTNSTPAITHNICSLTNNLQRNKKSNLNQLGRRNVGKEEKVFTTEKDMNSQPMTASTSDGTSSSGYQMINNSIEQNFNKLNTCSQEINAHKNVKTTKEKNRRHKKPMRRLQPEQNAGETSLNGNSGANNSSSNVPISNASSSVVTNSNACASTSTSGHNVSNSANNVIHGNLNKALFNNSNPPTNQVNKSDKNKSNVFVFQKKELVNITRNDFNFAQEHSNVRRSNSLNVKMNDLCASTSATQSTDVTNPIRKSITKSNSFTIRNKLNEPGPSQSFTEERQAYKNLKNNVNVENNPVVSSSNARDNLEEFRLEEATNDVCNIPPVSEEDHHDEDSENQADPLEAFSGLILNNCIENTTENHPTSLHKHGSSSSGVTNPQMIHNNFEPRCKKNKKCNEERDPLKQINSDNKPKPNGQ